MMAIVTHMTLKEGSEPEWDAVMHERMAAARNEPGWVGGQILIPLDALNKRIIVGTWQTRAEWEAWHTDPAFAETRVRLEGLEAAPSQSSWHEVTLDLRNARAPTGATYHRIAVALDGSAVAEAIVPEVLALARPMNAEIVLVRVVPSIPPAVVEGSRQVSAETGERIRQEAEQYLCEVAERVCGSELQVSTEVRTGDPVTEIVEATRECAADLIAMTTHGRSGLSRLLFGSVAEAVLRRAPVPVFFKRVTDGEGKRRAA